MATHKTHSNNDTEASYDWGSAFWLNHSPLTRDSPTIATEVLPDIFSSDVDCILLFANLFDCVPGLAYLQYVS